MEAYDQNGKPVKITIETRFSPINPFLVDGVEVITKKEQDQLNYVAEEYSKTFGGAFSAQILRDLLKGCE